MKFRRQQPIGPYIADFLCKSARIVVEADGIHHRPAPPHDVRRDHRLKAMGFTVLHFPNDLILYEPDRVLQMLNEHFGADSKALPAQDDDGPEDDTGPARN